MSLFLLLFVRFQKRSLGYVLSSRGFAGASAPKCAASDLAQLKSAREDIKELLNTTFCHPILVYLESHFVTFVSMRVIDCVW